MRELPVSLAANVKNSFTFEVVVEGQKIGDEEFGDGERQSRHCPEWRFLHFIEWRTIGRNVNTVSWINRIRIGNLDVFGFQADYIDVIVYGNSSYCVARNYNVSVLRA